MKYLLALIMCLGLVGCAGRGRIWEYEANENGELELKKMTEFKGKNIKCNTEKTGMETKNLEFPAFPVFR